MTECERCPACGGSPYYPTDALGRLRTICGTCHRDLTYTAPHLADDDDDPPRKHRRRT